MKNKKFLAAGFTALTITFSLAFFASSAFAQAAKTAELQKPAPASDASSQGFESTREWKKLTPEFQTQYSAAKKSGDMSQRVECFVRVRVPADAGDRTFLESHGFVVNVFAGPIARGHMNMSAVEDVAQLPFVDNINCHL